MDRTDAYDRTARPPSIARTYALVLGVILLIVGILGFIPGLTPDGNLLGIFAVNGLHNLVHILTGLAGIAAGLASDVEIPRMFALIFGIVYAVVTILGLIQGNTVLGLIPINAADNILHILITLSAFAVYFVSRSTDTVRTPRAV